MRWCLQIIIYYGLKVIGYYQNFFLLKISSIQRTPHLKYLKWSRSVVSDSLRPVDCSPPSSSVHGSLQARILEWVAISFSRGSSRPRDWTQVSHIAGRRFNLCATREALKYKNTASEKTSCRDTELQIQALTSKISKGGKEARLKEKGGGGRRGGAKVPQHNYYYKSEIYEISSK